MVARGQQLNQIGRQEGQAQGSAEISSIDALHLGKRPGRCAQCPVEVCPISEPQAKRLQDVGVGLTRLLTSGPDLLT